MEETVEEQKPFMNVGLDNACSFFFQFYDNYVP